jgi:hypothetical protein
MVFMNKCARSQSELSTGALGQNNLAILVHQAKGCFLCASVPLRYGSSSCQAENFRLLALNTKTARINFLP